MQRHYNEEKQLYRTDPAHVKVIDEQLKLLDIRWKAKDAEFWFNITAGLLLMGGFSGALLFSVPAAVSACLIVCSLAVAMYMSAGLYGDYKKQTLILDDKTTRDEDTAEQLTKVGHARTDLLIALAKNTIMPIVFMGALAVSWPAAILVAVLYIGYEFGKGYINPDRDQALPTPEPSLNGYELASEEDDRSSSLALSYS